MRASSASAGPFRKAATEVDVLLDPADGYFTLISKTKLDLSQPQTK